MVRGMAFTRSASQRRQHAQKRSWAQASQSSRSQSGSSLDPTEDIAEQLHRRRTGLQQRLHLSPSKRHMLHSHVLPYVQYYGIPMDKGATGGKDMNKIFASWWWDEDEVLIGSKSNWLSRVNVHTCKITEVPTLKGRLEPFGGSLSEIMADLTHDSFNSGIHCIVPSPSKHMFATGGQSVTSIAVYSLPDMKPRAVLEGFHKDWLFDTCWVDEERLFSCGRDGSVALWKLPNSGDPTTTDSELGYPCCNQPVVSMKHNPVTKLRSMDRVVGTNQVMVTSLQKTLFTFDIDHFPSSWRLLHSFPSAGEFSCSTFVKAHPTKPFMYAVGHNTGFILADWRQPMNRAMRHDSDGGYLFSSIRSLDFHGEVLSYGTAMGSLFLLDLRNNRYIQPAYRPELPNLPGCRAELNFSCLSPEAMERGVFPSTNRVENEDVDHLLRYYSALYTHSFSPDGYSVFCGGGPIPVTQQGSTACFWR